MDNVFFEAAKRRLRFNVNGSILVEDLFTVNYDLLSQYEESLSQEVEGFGKSRRGSNNVTVAQENTKLRFAIVTAVLDERDADKEKINQAKDRKEIEQKLLAEKARRNDESLTKMSDADLDAEIAKLKK